MYNTFLISIYLDTRHKKADGRFPVKLRIFTSNPRKQKLYATKFNFTENEFTSIWKTAKPRNEHKQSRFELQALEKAANETANKLPHFTFEDFERLMFGKSNRTLNINYYFEKAIEEHKAKGSISTSQSYIGTLRTRYKNARTLHQITAAIKVYYHYLSSSGQRLDNPAQCLRLKDLQNRDIQLQDLFTTTELERLLHSKKERYPLLQQRNAVLLSLLIYQGLKAQELAQLQTESIHLEKGTIRVQGTPKTHSRTLPLNPYQLRLLPAYIDQSRNKLLQGQACSFLLLGSRGEPFSAANISKHIQRNYGKLYAPRKLNCQTIRQSVISNLLKQNNDLRRVQVFAGHKYPSSTEQYRQTNLEALQLALEQHHPMQ